MRTCIYSIFLVGALTSACYASYIETWDSPVQGANNWMRYLYTEDYDHGINTLVSYHHSFPHGGYVSTLLGELDTDFAGANTAFPLYTLCETIEDTYPRSEEQIINLNEFSQVAIDIRLSAGANLAGATFRFFIGEWIEAEGSEPDKAAFWVFDEPFSYGQGSWQSSTIDIREGSWTTLAYYGYAPGQKTPQDYYDNPQQYGIVIYNVGPEGLSGTVYFDNFMVIPEPATLVLLSLGGLLAKRRRAIGSSSFGQ